MTKHRAQSTQTAWTSGLLLRAVVTVVIILWVGSLILNAVVPSYKPPETLGLAFMAILTGLIGAAAAQRSTKSKEEV